MKRHNITAKPWDYRSADLSIKESADGEWVHFTDVARLEQAARALLETFRDLAKALEDNK